MPRVNELPRVFEIIAIYDSDGNRIPLKRSEISGNYSFSNIGSFELFTTAIRLLGVNASHLIFNPDCPTCQVVVSCDDSVRDAPACKDSDQRD